MRNLLYAQLVPDAITNVFPFNFFNFRLSKLLNKFIYTHKSTPYFDENLISFLDFNINASLAKLVDTLRFSQEENLEVFPLWIFVQIITESLVNFV